jgi:tRNA U38,U39,U40 pseudouridine synthase TruA
MIRRMISVAVEVASGILPLDIIDRMMLDPAEFYNGPIQINTLAGSGLFLKSVEYNQEDLIIKSKDDLGILYDHNHEKGDEEEENIEKIKTNC